MWVGGYFVYRLLVPKRQTKRDTKENVTHTARGISLDLLKLLQ
jgi:hypothetical protein